jgi:beta-lactamase regulating signal transducer with metallopeptidase domain
MDSFLNCVVSNTALAGVLALVAFGLQRFWRSPQLAHALWFLVLVKLVTPPVFSVALPDRLVLWASRGAAPRSSGDAKHLRPSADAERAWALTASPSRPACRDGKPMQAAVDWPAMSESPAGPAEMTGMSTSPAPPGTFAVSSLANLLAAGWQGWLCAVWAAGVIVGMAILRRRLGRCRTLLIEAVDADAELVDDVRAFAKKLGIRSCPSIRVLDAHIPPLVCAGWRSLFLLVPARLLRELDREQRHAVLVHELAHIRRGDHLMRWFEIFVRGIFWWNPVAWWASRQLRQAEEECCDAWVVWALPDGQRSYGRALLWTVEFLAERRVVPVVAGTAFGDSHIKRRIEMVMTRKLNRKMSWGALLIVVLSAVCVLPVAAQKRPDTDAGDRAVAEREPQPETVTQVPKSAAEIRGLEARIERLERLLQELTQSLKASAATSGIKGESHRDRNSDQQRTESDIEIRYSTAAAKVAETELERMLAANRKAPGTVPDGEIERARLAVAKRTAASDWRARENRLKETLLALDKQAWDAASRRDWKVYEKLLRPGYYWGYFGSSRNGPPVKDVQRRRYFDVNMREVEVGKITEDVAFLKYVYDCKVEEVGQVQTYRDRQSMQIWTLIDGNWLLTYTTNFILTGGE